jgi:hypothetical protein
VNALLAGFSNKHVTEESHKNCTAIALCLGFELLLIFAPGVRQSRILLVGVEEPR